MGQEIASSQFTSEDFTEYTQRLKSETHLLGQYFAGIEKTEPLNSEFICGYEVEAWLIDNQGNPAPKNKTFLDTMNSCYTVPELASFNVELNAPAVNFNSDVLSQMESQLTQLWKQCQTCAHTIDTSLLAIGILPTVRQKDLTLKNMSESERYQALNEQVFLLRNGKHIELDIKGKDHLYTTHDDVMLEAAATSFQIHLQYPPHLGIRLHNASLILSAPLVALSANSPFLFGHQLWDESRIPLFEQAIPLGDLTHQNRVCFSSDYVKKSLFEIFEKNHNIFPVMLPVLFDTAPEQFAHLRLHNGTIWRWVRPLIGLDQNDKPHPRVEQRVTPSGPSIIDKVANVAFYYGAVVAMATAEEPFESQLDFVHCRKNFYQACRYSLDAQLKWLNNTNIKVVDLCQDQLLPLARKGLEQLGVDMDQADYYLDVIYQRIQNRQTGAAWQKRWVETYGKDWQQLVLAYQENQLNGLAVAQWKI